MSSNILLASQLLSSIPDALKKDLDDAYTNIIKNYRERRWEPSELNGGKFCEAVYSILKGYVDSNYPARAYKPNNMVDACRSLENAPSTAFPRSVRIQIPRMLLALYEIRNNRGVGHVGGDVSPNLMDATCVVQMCKWIYAELVRIFHDVDTTTASEAIESIVEKIIPIVWEIDGKLRVLDTNLTMKEKALVLLYHSSGAVEEQNLVDWVEHSNPAIFRRDILRKSHKAKLIEYNSDTKSVQISPKGVEFVEEKILGN